MPNTIQSLSIRYGIAFLALGIVLLLKKSLDPLVGVGSPYLLFFVSVMMSSWLGGFGPGVLASIMATLVCDYFFLTPGTTFLENPAEENFRLGLFCLEAVFISWGTAKLKRAQAELRQADRRKDDFLAMLAHELRNPLAAISNSLEWLRRSPPSEPGFQQAGDVIDRQVRQMVRLVEDLLDASRIRRGKVQLQKEAVEVAAIIARAEDTSRPLFACRQQTFAITWPAEPVWVDADPVRMTQILTNLLHNAAKFTGEGGRITLDAERTGEEICFRVRDSGIGISPEMLPRVFDLFTQAEATLERSQGGLGIGLTLVRRLVEMHGGRVEAFSAGPGQGSEFVVRLPVISDARIRRQTRQAATEIPLIGP